MEVSTTIVKKGSLTVRNQPPSAVPSGLPLSNTRAAELSVLAACYPRNQVAAVPSKFLALLLSVLAVSATVGCTDPPQFRENAVEIRKQVVVQGLEEDGGYPESHRKAVGNMVTALFGTPDAPRFPTEFSEDFIDLLPESPLVSQANLEMSAGAVSSDMQGDPVGLYRKHCVHCHGISGDGAGPTAAFLNPYPRDYRMGIFKYKSTPGAEKPTRNDLKEILINGVPGTSMSSFHLLGEKEIESLVDYVIYLTTRGEVERNLLRLLPEEFELDAEIFTIDPEDPDQYTDDVAFLIEEAVTPVLLGWAYAEDEVTEVPDRPEGLELGHADRDKLIDRGRELFMSADSGNCFSCHGYTGIGDGVIDNYDDWTKDWVEGAQVDLDDAEEVESFIQLGALKPRMVRPRNLRLGVYRGGHRPRDIYWRIKNGIKGSPMPAAASNMSSDDIWCIVEYVRQLPYEPLSGPGRQTVTSAKEAQE